MERRCKINKKEIIHHEKSELKSLITEEIKKILGEGIGSSKRNIITTKRTQEDIKKIQNVIEYFNKTYDL